MTLTSTRPDYAAARKAMIDSQLRTSGVKTLPPPGTNGAATGAAEDQGAAALLEAIEENFFFELSAGGAQVELVPVVQGLSFRDDEIPDRLRRQLDVSALDLLACLPAGLLACLLAWQQTFANL